MTTMAKAEEKAGHHIMHHFPAVDDVNSQQ